MKAYIIVRGMNLDDLTERVDELVVEGYIPVGGPANIGRYVIQAVYHPGVCRTMSRFDFTPPGKGFGTASGDCGDAVPIGKTA